MPLRQVHEIESAIEDKMALHGDIDHVFIHAEPVSDHGPRESEDETDS